MRVESLTDLANKHGSDKGTEGPSPTWPVHNYTDVYEAYLSPLRSQPVRLLEIGMGVPGVSWESQIAHGRNTGGGASVKMWHDYFLKGYIFGADINPAPHLDSDRITTFVVDQGERAQLIDMANTAGGDFDVIVDDGSHRPDHQQITFAALFPYLKPGGMFIIEDLLANGRGDPDMGRFSETSVLNTRRVLRSYADTGNFAGPNALGDTANLASGIASIAFHVPKIKRTVRVSLANGLSPRTAIRLITRYVRGTEYVAVIRKRDYDSSQKAVSEPGRGSR